MIDPDLRARAERWAADDPDPTTQSELRTLLANADKAGERALADLADRFAASLEFGTAGLRGVLGAGPNRMNRAVVLRTAWGLARYVLENVERAAERGVVIGFDARRMSAEFAEDTARVLGAHGIAAHLFRDVAPTPLTAFAVSKLNAAAGVMVTASHNPPEYNGYKVYWHNGAQIIPPIDAGIARAIHDAPSPAQIAQLAYADGARARVRTISSDVEEAYLGALSALVVRENRDRAFPIVYTPLHGVGGRLATTALARAGYTQVHVVQEQAAPDAAFPTVAFPNPEEKGTMDLALALARKVRAHLVFANDPDADRLAVAISDASSATGYMQLTGNQVGVLLGHYLLTEHPRSPANGRLILASNVSSPMLGVIAADLGARYEETLTGFKWIANRAMDLEAREHLAFVFGYEEALGYTVGDIVRDKDGISAALLFAEFVASLRARGANVATELEALYRKYGLFVSDQVSVTRKGASGAAQIHAIMSALRVSPPRAVGEYRVLAATDLADRTRTDFATGRKNPVPLPNADVLTFELSEGHRIIARPSGTEPKIKFYFDVREPISPDETYTSAEARAQKTMRELSNAFLKSLDVSR